LRVNCASIARQIAPLRHGTATFEKILFISSIMSETGDGLSLARQRWTK
jgi:hypothetical protein